MRRSMVWRTVLAACFALAFAFNGVWHGGAAAPPVGHLAAEEDYAAFFDPLLTAQLVDRNVAGAVVVVVKDGQIAYTRGYGLADVDQNVPVDAEQTLFRIGSVTKLFTWTAVMQLAAQGRLDLDADVNTYLDFTIPPTYPEPITMRHLMSHTAGFEDQLMGIFVAGEAQLQPPAQWLPAHLPARVRPAGEVSSYSNYGTALAGYIVERVSGMAYDDYLEAHILRPLEMGSTSARQPLPAALAQYLSHGYTYNEGVYTAQPFEFTQTAPAGSMSATAADMAAFMIAQLQLGRYGDQRILDEAAARQMHSPLYQHDPRLHGYAYGFQRLERAGQVLLSHAGDTATFHSELVLLPDDNTGLFLSYNTNRPRLRGRVVDAFLDRYYPVTLAPVAPPAGFAARADRFTGDYRSNRHAYTTVDKLVMLANPVWPIRAEGDLLVLDNPWRNETQRFAEVAPLLFQQVDGPERLAFRADERGNVTFAFLESEPSFALEKVRWHDSAPFHLGMLSAALLLFLTTPLAGAAGFARRRRRPTPASAQPRLARAARWAAAAVAGLSVLFLVGTAFTAARLMASLGADADSAALLNLLAILPPIIAALTALSLALLFPVWQQRFWSLRVRVYHTLLVAAGVVFVWFMLYWNLFWRG
jgi:CubicO group peptidase (beta-lactamase class C family)